MMEQVVVNLAPKAEFDSPFLDPRGHQQSTAKGPTSPRLSRSAMSMLRTKLSNFRHPVTVSVRGQSEDELFQSKMRVLTKNPAIFHEFKDRLAEAQEQSHSKAGVSIILHNFLENELRMPELHDEITMSESEQSTRALRKRAGGRARRPLGLLASYLGGESPSSSSTGRSGRSAQKNAKNFEGIKSSLFFETSKLDDVDPSVPDNTPSLDLSETSCSCEEDDIGDSDDSISTASF